MDKKVGQISGDPIGQVSLLLPIAVACGNFVTALDQNVVITALPAIGRSLGEAPTTLGLTLTAYVAALVIGLPLGGWASDRFGPRRVYGCAALAFTAASMLCGLSDTFWQLVTMRVLQGFAGAFLGSVGQATLLSGFPSHRRLRVNTYASLASQVAPLAGPLLGGMLATYLSWRWIFFINLPFGLLISVLARRFFPIRASRQASPFDIKGFALIALGMALVIFGLNSVADGSRVRWTALVQPSVGLLVLALAVRHSLRTRYPLLDFGILRIPTFRISLLTGGGVDTIGLVAVMFVLPLMLQVGFGMSAARSGSLTFLVALGSISARIFVPVFVRRFGFRRVLVANTPVLAAVVAAFALVQPSTPIWLTAGLIVLFGVLRSLQWGTTSNLAYADVPHDSLARFSGMYYMLWYLAVALSFGSASTFLALLAGDQPHLTVANFHAAFIVAALVIIFALVAYLRLRPEDGHKVSGHRIDAVLAEQHTS